MISIVEAFETLDVPEKCRSCPPIGEFVVSYAANVGANDLLGDLALGDELAERMAARLARDKGISFDEAMSFVTEHGKVLRQTTAVVINENDAETAVLAQQVATMLAACRDGAQLQAVETPVFICMSDSQSS